MGIGYIQGLYIGRVVWVDALTPPDVPEVARDFKASTCLGRNRGKIVLFGVLGLLDLNGTCEII